MKERPITVTFTNVNWYDWNEIRDLIAETETLARNVLSEEESAGLEIAWQVSMADQYTVRIQFGFISESRSEHPAHFEVTLYCKDLEDGTTIRLFDTVLSHTSYKGIVSGAIALAIRKAPKAVFS